MKLNFTKSQIFDFIILCFCIILGIVLCFVFGQDSDWDLSNYHLYNPWAFFTGRIGYDIMPCGVQSYINPVIDFPLYFLVKYFNNHPYFIEAVQSVWYGISVFFIYKISKIIFNSENKKLNYFLIFISVLLGATNIVAIMEIGLSYGDLVTSSFILAALYFYLKGLYSEESSKKLSILFLSSFLFGFVTGLKVTGAIFFLTFLILHIVYLIKNKENILKQLLIITAGFGIGFLITGLWWYILIWSKFKNPFFPMMNNIFKSEFALPLSHADLRHFPQTVMGYIFYPFYWIFAPDDRPYVSFVIEAKNIDYRPVFVYIFSVIIVIREFFLKITKSSQTYTNSEKIILYITLFTVISYIFWLNTSCILRYIMPLEMLSGVCIAGGLYFLFKNKSKILVILISILTLFTLFSTKYINPEIGGYRIPFGEKFIFTQSHNFPDNAVVCLCGGFPYQAFLQFQNEKARNIFLFGETENYSFIYPENEEEKIKEITNNSENEIYAVFSEAEDIVPINWEYIGKFIDIKSNPDKWECIDIPTDYDPNYKLCKRNK